MTVLKLYPNVIRCIGLHLQGKRAIAYSEHANIAKNRGTVPPLVINVHQEVYQENAMPTAILVNMTDL